MNVDSNNMEFGNELFAVLPWAYWLYRNGKLDSTRSATGTEPFYYFSQNHTINTEKRFSGQIWSAVIPNVNVHKFTGKGQWYAPPYKANYMNSEFVYDKPIMVIANKYNMEWNAEPVNYLDTDTVLKIMELNSQYQIFYNRYTPEHLSDDQYRMDMGEHEVIRREFPDVKFIMALPGNFNLNQLMVYANCERFVSVQGGNSILASYFGGRNIVYAVKGHELRGGFYNKLRKLSGCDVVHVRTYVELLNKLNHGN